MWAYNAGSVGIPITFVSGDSFAVQEIKDLGLDTICVETKNQSDTPKPEVICSRIRASVAKALTKVIAPLCAQKSFSIIFFSNRQRKLRKFPKNTLADWKENVS